MKTHKGHTMFRKHEFKTLAVNAVVRYYKAEEETYLRTRRQQKDTGLEEHIPSLRKRRKYVQTKQ